MGAKEQEAQKEREMWIPLGAFKGKQVRKGWEGKLWWNPLETEVGGFVSWSVAIEVFCFPNQFINIRTSKAIEMENPNSHSITGEREETEISLGF